MYGSPECLKTFLAIIFPQKINLCDYFNRWMRMHCCTKGHLLVFRRTIDVPVSNENRKGARRTREGTDQAVWLIEKCGTILPQPGPPSSLSDQSRLHSRPIHPSCFALSAHYCNLDVINSSHSTPLFFYFRHDGFSQICVQNRVDS